MEGIFGRGADSLPAGILRRLVTAIEKGAVVKGDRRWAPPDCHILLTREAMRLVLPIQAELEEELRVALARFAVQAGLSFPESPAVQVRGRRRGGCSGSLGQCHVPLAACRRKIRTRHWRRRRPLRPRSTGGSAKAPERAWLRVEAGPDTGREFQLIQGKMVIGRQSSNHVVLDDPNVSRQHASLVFERGGYSLVDLGSTNGTLVNEKAVTRHRLRNGDRIRLGQTELIFH